MQEIWKPVVGYEGIYEVSSEGRVWSLNRYVDDVMRGKAFIKCRYMKRSVNRSGYLEVRLSKLSKTESPTVHKIVMLSFVGVRPHDLVVNHIDGDRANNRLDNLEYVTHRENSIKGRGCLYKKDKTSSFVGVYWDKSRQKWHAQKRFGSKAFNLGVFDREEDAGNAYLKATLDSCLEDALKRRSNMASVHRGVTWHRRSKRWEARVTVLGKRIHVGHYKNEDEANRACIEFRKANGIKELRYAIRS